ncbi:MAG: aminoacyl-histidine dipeptidase [Lutispora sp.]|nr:aminoacyl-histidine dipeptidase [Lutispora sp.]MDD4834853.1 aminoacyl-histidine dipeptidase [Lutispora sp.]
MTRILEGLKPERVFYYFEELSNIPRGSGNEKQVSDYLYNLFKEKGFETIQDKSLNVVIKKPASKGYENAPTVMLQGHMDMVCEKNADVDHDFEKDPLKLRIIDDNIYATGTTLGADNGIGVAMALAILEDNTLQHPPLEVVLTSDEERGMVGATNLDCSKLKSKILLNLDNGGEGVFTAGCAGGGGVIYTIPISKVKQNKKNGFKLSVRGLIGGHSGADIHRGRGNANKIIGRILYDIKNLVEISEINGGSKDNAIPREADVILSCDHKEKLENKIEEWNTIFKNEFAVSDKDIDIVLEETKLQTEIFDEITKDKVIVAINLIPNGINTKDNEINLVISSNNLGVIETKEQNVIIKNSVRSSIETNIYRDLLPQMKIISEVLDIKYEVSEFYPGWQYEKDSFIRELCVKTYERLNENKAKVSAIHAGLECGFLVGKIDKLDAVSFGPVMDGAHTPEENVNIPSVERTYNFIVEVLKSIS